MRCVKSKGRGEREGEGEGGKVEEEKKGAWMKRKGSVGKKRKEGIE